MKIAYVAATLALVATPTLGLAQSERLNERVPGTGRLNERAVPQLPGRYGPNPYLGQDTFSPFAKNPVIPYNSVPPGWQYQQTPFAAPSEEGGTPSVRGPTPYEEGGRTPYEQGGTTPYEQGSSSTGIGQRLGTPPGQGSSSTGIGQRLEAPSEQGSSTGTNKLGQRLGTPSEQAGAPSEEGGSSAPLGIKRTPSFSTPSQKGGTPSEQGGAPSQGGGTDQTGSQQ
jgi:collagen type III alpha